MLPWGAFAFTNPKAKQVILAKSLESRRGKGIDATNNLFNFTKIRVAYALSLMAIWAEFTAGVDSKDPDAQREKEMVYRGLEEFHKRDSPGGFQEVLREHSRAYIDRTRLQWPQLSKAADHFNTPRDNHGAATDQNSSKRLRIEDSEEDLPGKEVRWSAQRNEHANSQSNNCVVEPKFDGEEDPAKQRDSTETSRKCDNDDE
ncbi:hypothetical protein LZ554_006687 [Drepanopeziza brunnea f. sp. 'monogermtubi']|nr:hypothetical protein LZ554_006687 [Drepanopeziza brunnea f. sp. 'monogermtubi']